MAALRKRRECQWGTKVLKKGYPSQSIKLVIKAAARK
jgi:hypothetical protein